MKITILGGGAAGGNTGTGCSGYLMQFAGTTVVFDLGPGTFAELRKHCDFRMVDGIVITHWHLDHFLDLAAFRFAAAYSPQPLERRIPLYLPPDTSSLLKRFGSALSYDESADRFFDEWFALVEFDPSKALRIKDLNLEFHPTRHFVPCWAARVSDTEGKSAGYTADTGPGAELEDFFMGVGLLIAEATELQRDPEVVDIGHMTSAEAGTLATNCKADTLVLTHMWEEHGFDNHLKRAGETFGGKVLLARPGLQVTLGEERQ
jgi:ribonuclease BN (tRNA processing enzyme)